MPMRAQRPDFEGGSGPCPRRTQRNFREAIHRAEKCDLLASWKELQRNCASLMAARCCSPQSSWHPRFRFRGRTRRAECVDGQMSVCRYSL
jgi:hypothetical protein